MKCKGPCGGEKGPGKGEWGVRVRGIDGERLGQWRALH